MVNLTLIQYFVVFPYLLLLVIDPQLIELNKADQVFREKWAFHELHFYAIIIQIREI